jgi:3-(3-hydroxy-phenyl)propionate hydroxylase
VPDRYQFVTAAGETLLDFPVNAQGDFGWAETYALHQPAVEAALRQRMEELGVDVRLGTSFRSLTQDDEGVSAELEGEQGVYMVRARFLVGCDGAWSPVRESLGIGLEDYHFDEPWLVLDTIIEEPGDLPIVCQQICDPARPVTHMAMSGKRFRWEFMLKPGETAEEMLHDDRIHELMAPWKCADRMQIERKAVYRFHGLVAERWRVGRVLIAGDAAHQMPPFAGQGMCSGIRDAANLAWKLALVVRGEAVLDILDTYQQEREPHVRAIIETAIAMGKVVCMLDPVAAAARNEQMLARKRSGAQDVSVQYPDLRDGMLLPSPRAGALFPQPRSPGGHRLDEVLGVEAVVIGRGISPGTRAGLRFMSPEDESLRPFRPIIDAWLSAAEAPAVLVRPDKHVFGTGAPEHLAKAWHDLSRNQPAA